MAAPAPDRHNPFSASKAWLRALERTAQIEREPQRTLPVVIGELATRFGAAPALLSDRGNPSMDNLAAIFGVVQKRLGVNIRTQTVKAA